MIPPHAKVRPIITLVAQHYGFTLDDVLSKSRNPSISRCRAIAFFVSREVSYASYPELGMVFGCDHTTVISACKRVVAWMANDDVIYREVGMLIAKASDTGAKEQTCSGIVWDGVGCTEVSCA